MPRHKPPLPNGVWDPYDYFHVNSIQRDRDGNRHKYANGYAHLAR